MKEIWGLLMALFMFATQGVHGFVDLDNLTQTCDDSLGRGCSNGVCTNGVCVCNALWSNKTDFVEMNDCANSFIGTWVLWGINIVALIWCYFKSMGVILVRFEVFRETKKNRKGYGLWQNKGLVAIICYFGISTPAHLAMAILHFVDPETRVGFDLLPTFLFFFAKLGFYVCIFFVQSTMFSTTMQGGDLYQKRLVKINYVFYFAVSFLSTLIGTFAFITFAILQDDLGAQIMLMRGYYLTQAMTLLWNGTGAFIVLRTANRALDRVRDISTGQHRGEGIRRKINELQGTAMRQALLQGVVYLLMGAIPFFINKHGYFLPMSWLAMPVIGKKLSHQFVTDKGAKTIMERLGIKKTGNTSSLAENPTSRSNQGDKNGKPPSTVAGGVAPSSPTNMVASSMMDSVNPTYNPSLRDYKKKAKLDDQQKSSFLSENTLLEELLDPDHPMNKRFLKFVESRYAQNEAALLGLCIKYKNASDSKERTKIGKQLMKEFIEVGAPRAVDLPDEQKQILLSTAKRSQWVPTTLDPIRRLMAHELKGNFLHKFENQLEAEAQKVDV